ncbi:MAG: reverse transcriptase domain-containing protein [Cyanobacteria bacterium J06629_18]
MTTGLTNLIAKTLETENPKNYRPITCLPTMYKLMTALLTERIYLHLERVNGIPREQKGCKRGAWGCKDHLFINKVILNECKTKKKNLATAWIDYQKAFDSVPHSWIVKCMEMYKISPVVVNFLKVIMKNWKTTLLLQTESETIRTRAIQIKSGIFQGDSLSPLLFCLTLAPLSSLLNNIKKGYKLGGELFNHLLYMDDLKLFAGNNDQLATLMNVVKDFSDDIKMKFGINKCAKATFHRGKLIATEELILNDDTKIRELEHGDIYKYLGIDEGDGIKHNLMKEKIRKEYCRRVRMILRSELNSRNKIEAINILAVPVVIYGFGIINWSISEIQKLDIKTRKMLTMEKMHHPKANVERIYQQRKDGGRGLMKLETSYKIAIVGLVEYLESNDDHLLKLAWEYEKNKNTRSLADERVKIYNELEMNTDLKEDGQTKIQSVKKIKQEVKNRILKRDARIWEEKALHGKFVKRIRECDVDRIATHAWLNSTGLKGETEGLIIAAQDQSLPTKLHQAKITKVINDSSCRVCGEKDESVDHIITGCKDLAMNEYLDRHNKVATFVHWEICKHYCIEVEDKSYNHKPQKVTENNDVTILWDMQIQTDRHIPANRPDIVIKDRREGKCWLIDVSVPSDVNISSKTTEKIRKYKDLEIEITKMWSMRTEIVPVIVGALGVIKKGSEEYLKKIPGKISQKQLQKIALLGSAHILRKILSIK